MKLLDSQYFKGLYILRNVLENFEGVQTFNSFATSDDRVYATTILNIDVDFYHITVEYNGRYGYMDIVCPSALYNAITLHDDYHCDFLKLNQMIVKPNKIIKK